MIFQNLKSVVFLAFLLPLSICSAGTIRIDFGRNNGDDGDPTASPDANGNYWNNLVSDSLDASTGLSVTGLVETDNTSTSVGITCSGGAWRANGIRNGGLQNPDSALLGDLAISTATHDYFYVETPNGGSGKLTISGLSPTNLYTIRMFGTRTTSEVRRSLYTLAAGSGAQQVELQTSGAGSGSAANPEGNDDTIVEFTNLQANPHGSVEITLTIAESSFAYLGAMEIIKGDEVPELEPSVPSSLSTWVTQDELDPPSPGAVLFIGSSSIRRWESLTRDFSDYRVIQRGWGGSWLREMDEATPYVVFPYQPSAIVMWAGTNDLSGGQSGEQVHADFIIFLNALRAQLPTVPFLYLGVTPTPANGGTTSARQLANQLISETADTDPNTYFVDLPAYFEGLSESELDALYVDPIHLNRAGYGEWLKIIRPQLEAVLSPNKEDFNNPSAPQTGDSIFFDFGPDNAGLDGSSTSSPDANGNHWNNWFSIGGGAGVNSGEHLANLVNDQGVATGVRMTIIGGYNVNGRRNGGLFSPNGPDSNLLGELAIETATEDYFFSSADDLTNGGSDDVTGGFMLDGLNPNLAYELRLFGSRETSETRITEYAVYGANQKTTILQTSGVDIGNNGTYDGNDDEVAMISGIRPDQFGQIFVDQTLLQGSFAYINAVELRAVSPPQTINWWRLEHYTFAELEDAASEATIWGDDADPDGDGLVNLVEYASGTDPRAPQVNPFQVSLNGDQTAFELTFPKNTLADDISWSAETSTDLSEWTVVSDSLVSTNGNIETRSASVMTTGINRLFFRLRSSFLTD